MQTPSPKSTTLTTGLAMFSMFFGAGNVVFPLALGQYAQSQNLYAILGLLITAVGVPFIGLIAMTLFDGNYRFFFDRIGKIPSYLVVLTIMGLIGPFGALPRCIALSFSTIQSYTSSIHPTLFSLFSCFIIYLFTYRKNRIVDILGTVLTPFLLISLCIIIIKGFLTGPALIPSLNDPLETFLVGFKEGYQTIDLLGAFFFCSVVLSCLQQDSTSVQKNYKKMVFLTLKASCIGVGLLSLVYMGFSYVAAFYSPALAGVAKDRILGVVAYQTLGPYAGIVAILAVALACLTTAIALAAVFADYLHKTICQEKISYRLSLLITLVISFFISTLNFNGIASFLGPILQVCYPALIGLCILNIAYKTAHFKPVKTPVLIIFIMSLISYFY